MTLVPVKVVSAPPSGSVAWAEGLDFFIPLELSRKLKNHLTPDNQLSVPAHSIAALKTDDDLRLIGAYTEQRPLSSRMPFSYQLVPPPVRTAIAKMTGKKNKAYLDAASFPRWPLDLSADFLDDLFNPKPRRAKTPVLLTHDLDSPEGLDNLVKTFLPFEESVGAKTINFIVPGGWRIDEAKLEKVYNRGHEIGIHGFNHSNKTPFLSQAARLKRLGAAKNLIARYAIQGYRAPSLLRTRALLRDLGAFYTYDSSIPTSGGLFPVPGNGCATARPFILENIREIPVSLPRDGSLLFMGYSPREILDLWVDCADKIHRASGVVVLLTHCEKRFTGSERLFSVYRDFLKYLQSSSRFYWSTSREVLKEFLG